MYIALFICMIIFALSIAMMELYLCKRKLHPRWKILLGLVGPITFLKTYINNTKKEYGHVGIWFKLFVISYVLAMTIGIIGAIQYSGEKGQPPSPSKGNITENSIKK